MKLPVLREKALLEAIEASEKERSDIVLKELCAKNVVMFGKSGTEERQRIQEYFNNLKHQSIRSYASKLDEVQVAHGSATSRLLCTEGRCPSLDCDTDSMMDSLTRNVGEKFSITGDDEEMIEDDEDSAGYKESTTSETPQPQSETLSPQSSPPRRALFQNLAKSQHLLEQKTHLMSNMLSRHQKRLKNDSPFPISFSIIHFQK